MGIPEHGLLKEGWDANVCVFDYDRLHATADFAIPIARVRASTTFWSTASWPSGTEKPLASGPARY